MKRLNHTEDLHETLGAALGEEHVRPATTADVVDGVQPKLIAEPGSPDEVARVLLIAQEAGLSVMPRGGGTKASWGGLPSGIDLIISTRRINRVVEHAHDDLTVTVESGCRIADLQRELAKQNQRLSLDPLWPTASTVGGVLATNDSGPLRVKFGPARNLILGVTVALSDGTLARSGGKVVKNVAGYDLPKLMTGAYGTLGVITEATFRLHALPSRICDASFQVPTIGALDSLLENIADSKIVPSSVQVRTGRETPLNLDVRFEGVEASLDAQVHQLTLMAAGAKMVTSSAAVWREYEDLWAHRGAALVCRVSMRPSLIASFIGNARRITASLQTSWRMVIQADGVGILRLEATDIQAAVQAVERLRTTEEISTRP